MPQPIHEYNKPPGMNQIPEQCTEIPDEMAGTRLDQVLATLFPDYSRSRLQSWIKQGLVTVNGDTWRPRDLVLGGERVRLQPQLEASETIQAEAIELDVVYQDEALLVVNKPAGMVVHPGAGNRDGTLLNALLHLDSELAGLPRCGLVHRIDKDTSGLLIVARSLTAHTQLVQQLQARAFVREYLTLVQGELIAGGTIDASLGRHPVDRKRYTVREDGKWAVTHYRIASRLPRHTLLRVKLETGRTHQIRVHMAHIKHPIVGDPVYGGRFRLPPGTDEETAEVLRQFKRQALHAARLGVVHPMTGEAMEWQVDMPEDMQTLLKVLESLAT